MPTVATDPITSSYGLSNPETRAFAVTPSDTDELVSVTRGLYVGGTGTVVAVLAGDTAAVSFVGVPAGTVLHFRVKQVKSTGTTATNLVGLY